ncbi:MAG TPA: NAD(P)/FAD-dependent oxidoreductase [Desulfosalsimonadaceae bacterium]|nr:NAD(P)/FAD-dependent oxidoreductase [Desulfosalsimonadaceae bacterium]
MAEDLQGAILQRDGESYAIVPRSPAGILSVENLESITRVVKKYQIPVVKITSGHRLVLVGIKKDDIPSVWQDLGMDIGRATELCFHYVQACPGTAVCRFGVQDSLGLATELEKRFYNMEFAAKVKFGISGCSFCCGESYVRDVGLIGRKKGWTLVFGGNSGKKPRIGDVLAEDVETDALMDMIEKLLVFYRDNAKKKERTPRFAERIGVSEIQQAIGV